MSTLPKTFVTPEEYLELERKAEYKSEYCNGEIFAMSGASRKHDVIAMQLHMLVAQHLRGKKCRSHTSDMRVLVASSGLYTYPDLSATCDEPQYADAHVDTLLNPTLVVEIVSPSTEGYDRGKKASLYRAMPSLKELLLIAQEEYAVQLYRRQEDGRWIVLDAAGLDAAVELTSIGCTLQLGELYENVITPAE
jgi:Uma2 family endonuclease